MTAVSIDHWVKETARIREQDGGYTFESLAMAMVIKLGWADAARIVRAIKPHIHGWYIDEDSRQVAPLVDFLGWEQSALLHAWFENLDNYRMVRDEFPNGGGIRRMIGGAR